MKFYPSDWRGDPRLRMCSIGARGMWMEMMCIMHEANPYGHLVVGDVPVTNRQLASLAGISQSDCLKFMAELESAGVYSRQEGTKIIYSRRMVRDRAKSEEGRAHIKKRWPDGGGDGGERHPKPTRSPSRDPNRSPTADPITPEARDQIDDVAGTRAGATHIDDGWPEDFREQFWQRYPHKVGKPKALAKLDGVRKRGVLVEWPALMAGLDRYIRDKPPDRQWLNPETFLNQDRWADQPAIITAANFGGTDAQTDNNRSSVHHLRGAPGKGGGLGRLRANLRAGQSSG